MRVISNEKRLLFRKNLIRTFNPVGDSKADGLKSVPAGILFIMTAPRTAYRQLIPAVVKKKLRRPEVILIPFSLGGIRSF